MTTVSVTGYVTRFSLSSGTRNGIINGQISITGNDDGLTFGSRVDVVIGGVNLSGTYLGAITVASDSYEVFRDGNGNIYVAGNKRLSNTQLAEFRMGGTKGDTFEGDEGNDYIRACPV